MNRDDWIGLGTSVGVHLALALLCALLVAGRPEAPALGAVQLEIGAFAEGRPVQQSETRSEETEAETSRSAPAANEEPSSEETPPEAAPAQSTPVNLPEQEQTSGEEPPPEEPPSEPEEDAPPAQQASEEREPAAQPSEQEETSVSSEAPTENAAAEEGASQAESAEAEEESGEEAGETTGAASGEEGTGADEEEAAPFDIEGLDRTRLYGSMPQYTEKVNATIQVEITVSPQGRVVGQRLTQKANPSLERSVMEALRQWRFNRLPSGAPQVSQTGVVTFRFRLE